MDNENITDLELREFFLKFVSKVLKTIEVQELNESSPIINQIQKDTLINFNYLNNIDNLFSDLKKTHTFIKRYPIKNYYEKNQINQLDYIKYHYEVFIHKIHTILELMKHWVNEYYHIGLKDKECNWINLKKHNDKINKELLNIIDKYFLTFEHIINFRHQNTHKAFYKDSKNDELKKFNLIYESSKKFHLDIEDIKKIKPKFELDYQIKEYKKEKLNHIQEGNQIVEIYIEKFITIILNDFLNNLMKYNNEK